MALFSKKTAEKEEVKNQPAPEGKSSGVTDIKLPKALVQPRISEKAGKQVQLNKYVFKVQKGANKIEVKKAVESAYKVKVTQVNMVNVKGKHRNYGRTSGKTSNFKKATVTLKKGDSIQGLTDVV